MTEAWKEFFNPVLKARKRRALELVAEAERRKRQAELESEIGAIAASPVIQRYRREILAWAETVAPSEDMSAADCYWFRKGLERAIDVLDERLFAAEQGDSE